MLAGYDIGAVDYLTKPVDPQILKSKVSVFVDLFRSNRTLAATNFLLEYEIAERKQVELARDRLAAIVEYSSDAILSKTPEGVITSWNRGAQQMFGYTAEEIVGRSVSTLIPADRSDELALNLDCIQREESVEPFETMRVRKDGRLIHVSLTLSPIKDEAGRVTGVSAIMKDVSERKRLEAEILQVSEREQRRIAEDLHDGVGQQLGGISCLSDVLKKNLAEKASPEAAAAARISKLLNVAVAQTRSVARGLYPVEPETNGLMSALEDLAARVTDLFKVSCQYECPQPVLIEDNAMATHLYRIAQEAATNSVKHGNAQHIKIGLSSPPERIILTVSDDGAGFKRNERHSKGLGLRIMNHRASVIGGNIVVQKNTGGGTLVVCTVQTNGGHSQKK
jgi:PAS domain S-box-containing protein